MAHYPHHLQTGAVLCAETAPAASAASARGMRDSRLTLTAPAHPPDGIASTPLEYPRLLGPRRLFKHRFHFRLMVGLPLIEWKHAVYQPHAAKALIFAVVLA